MEGLATLIIGLLIRFGIPIALTLIVVIFLRRLDARWQSEAEGQIAERGSLLPQVRCWVFNDCPQEERDRCRAYAEADTPCWQIFRDGNGRVREKCLDCDYFRSVPIPTPMRSSLQEMPK